LSKSCTSEPRTPCSYFEGTSRYLVSCIGTFSSSMFFACHFNLGYSGGGEHL
uniref:Ovule protein n=1 Tax=Haemonchus placei TaxID=6290 RepID=A0A0N4WCV0_HAEPC